MFAYIMNTSLVSDLQVRIREDRYYGSLEVNRYGFWGPVCHFGWDDADANVTCHELGFLGGVTFNGSTTLTTPIAVGSFDCNGKERKLGECSYPGFGEDTGCSLPMEHLLFDRPTAGVLCFNHPGMCSLACH